MVLPFNSSLYINYEKDRIYIEPRRQTHVDPVTRIVPKSHKKLDASGLNSAPLPGEDKIPHSSGHIQGYTWYRVFSHDVTAAILVSQNNKTAAMLVSQTSPVGVELFSYANAFFCSKKFA